MVRHEVTVERESGDWGEGAEVLMRDLGCEVLDLKLRAEWEGCEVRVGVDVSLSDDERVREMNREWRGGDEPTDVLSFPQYSDEDVRGLLGEGGVSEEVEQRLRGGQVLVLGDVVMSWSVLKRQSEELGISWEERGSWLLVHGFLHLLGYDHERGEEEAREMEFEEDDLRRRCGLWKEVKR